METGVGAALREARKRQRLELSDVEAAIKIRARYLRALENEEWDALPGGVYTRSFIRTYAGHLGLDGERLADEYRRSAAGESEAKPGDAVVAGPVRRSRRPSGRLLAGLVSLVLAALVVAIGLAGDDGSPGPAAPPVPDAARPASDGRTTVAEAPGVSLRLAATGEVWVCLLGRGEAPLVDGEILAPGAEAGPFRAAGFSAAFGNGQVEITVDGRRAGTPPSSGPVGYEIDAGGELRPLEEGERPDCE